MYDDDFEKIIAAETRKALIECSGAGYDLRKRVQYEPWSPTELQQQTLQQETKKIKLSPYVGTFVFIFGVY